jgi:hypothetical protein
MELSEIRQLEKVVDRLKAAGPSGVSPPHCWFCGKLSPWFWCDCRDAVDARAGKRAKPLVVDREGQMLIVLDPEVMARPHNQGRKRYVAPANSPPVTPVTPVTPVERNGAPESVTGAGLVTPLDPGVTPVRSTAAERMRRMRERKAKRDG